MTELERIQREGEKLGVDVRKIINRRMGRRVIYGFQKGPVEASWYYDRRWPRVDFRVAGYQIPGLSIYGFPREKKLTNIDILRALVSQAEQPRRCLQHGIEAEETELISRLRDLQDQKARVRKMRQALASLK